MSEPVTFSLTVPDPSDRPGAFIEFDIGLSTTRDFSGLQCVLAAVVLLRIASQGSDDAKQRARIDDIIRRLTNCASQPPMPPRDPAPAGVLQ